MRALFVVFVTAMFVVLARGVVQGYMSLDSVGWFVAGYLSADILHSNIRR